MKRALGLLLLVLLLGAGAGGWWWFNQPSQVLKRLERQTTQAIAGGQKAAQQKALKDVDEFFKRFAGKLTPAQDRAARLLGLDLARRGLKDKNELLDRLVDFQREHPRDTLSDKFLAEEADLWWKHKKQPLKARKRLQARLKTRPLPKDEDLGELLFKLGQVNDALGEFDEAADAYQELVDDLPKHKRADEALMRLAEIYATRLDREEEARKAYEKLAEKSPHSELGREAKERARELKQWGGQGGGAGESQQMVTFIQQSGDELLQQILKQPKKITWMHTAVRLGKLSLSVSGSMGVVVNGEISGSLDFLYNDNFRLRSLTLNGQHRKPQSLGEAIKIPLDKPLKKGDTLMLRWQGRLSLKPPSGPLGKVNKLRPVPVGGMGLVSAREGYLTSADLWYPALDYDAQFTLTTDVDFPARLTAIAAGVRQNERRAGGRYRARWQMPVAHGHNSLCYGRFAEKSDGPYTTYLSPADAKHAPGLLALTKKAMAFYTQRFGLSKYPVVKICQIESPVFKGYAEATLVMLGGREAARARDTGVLAHELAHQWWGNQIPVSLASTKPWLWEGFASYSDVLFEAHEKGDAQARHKLDLMATRFFHDLLRYGDVAISENTFEHPGYLGVVYQKGAWVLHMLRGQMGEGQFTQSLRRYATDRTDRAVTLPVFKTALKQSSGRDWGVFLDQWINRPGYLRVEPAGLTQQGGRLRGDLLQGEPVYDLTVQVKVLGERNLAAQRPVAIREATTPFGFSPPFDVKEVVVDPDGWLFKAPGNGHRAKVGAVAAP